MLGAILSKLKWAAMVAPLLVSASAVADGWKPEAIAFARANYTQPPMADYDAGRDPYIATLWGAASRKARLALAISLYHREIPMPELFDKPVAVEFVQHYGRVLEKDPNNRRNLPLVRKFKVKAPLIVFVPGIFADSSDITGQMTIKWFSRMGYHVLIVPNPLGPGYLLAGPHKTEDPSVDQALFVVEATRYAVQKMIGPEWVSSVALAGESLGAAVAAAAYARDSLETNPIFDNGVSLFWPPISLSHSVANMDEGIVGSLDKYEHQCKGLIENFRFRIRVFFAQILSDPTEEERDCAQSLVMQFGYKGDLLRTTRIIETGTDPGASDTDHPLEPVNDWERHLTFSTFIKEVAPFYKQTLDQQNPKNELAHWLSVASAHTPYRLARTHFDR